MSQATIARAIENMRSFPRLRWHLMPGNHDHFRENGLWDRLARTQLPDNIQLHIKSGAAKIAGGRRRSRLSSTGASAPTSSADDLSIYMDNETTPEGAICIGLAHGSIQGFGSEGEAGNYVAPNRAETAGLADPSHLAIGIVRSRSMTAAGTPDARARPVQAAAAKVMSLCNGGAALLVEYLRLHAWCRLFTRLRLAATPGTWSKRP